MNIFKTMINLIICCTGGSLFCAVTFDGSQQDRQSISVVSVNISERDEQAMSVQPQNQITEAEIAKWVTEIEGYRVGKELEPEYQRVFWNSYREFFFPKIHNRARGRAIHDDARHRTTIYSANYVNLNNRRTKNKS